MFRDFFFRVSGKIDEIVFTIKEGANEFINPGDSRKRSRPDTPLPPRASPSPRTSSPSIFPRHSSTNSHHIQQQHPHDAHNNNNSSNNHVTNDHIQQPQTKRRRLSFQQSLDNNINDNNNINRNRNRNPFHPIRRDSSQLGQALDAPTPPSLSFFAHQQQQHNSTTNNFYQSAFNPSVYSPRATSNIYTPHRYAHEKYAFNSHTALQNKQPQNRPPPARSINNGYYSATVTNALRSNPTSLYLARKKQQQQSQNIRLSIRQSNINKNGNRKKLNAQQPQKVNQSFEKPKIPSSVTNLPTLLERNEEYPNQVIPTSFLQLAKRRYQLQNRKYPENENTRLLLEKAKEQVLLEKEMKLQEEQRLKNEKKFAKQMTQSKKRSSDLTLELFIKEQQHLQNLQKRRQEAQRMLHKSIESSNNIDICGITKKEAQIQVEKPPKNANYWNQIYWRNVNSEYWNENNDSNALDERERRVTVNDAGTSSSISSSAYAPMTDSALKRLRLYLSNEQNRYKELAKFNGCIITGEDLRLLKPNCWLNDEVVNAYTYLLEARNQEVRSKVESMKSNGGRSNDMADDDDDDDIENDNSIENGHYNNNVYINGNGKSNCRKIRKKERYNCYSNNSNDMIKPPSVKMMNSFFFTKLVEVDRITKEEKYNYQRVRRWTRKFDIFSYDKMVIPINQQNVHWTLGVIDLKKKQVMHLDSMGTGGSPKVRNYLLRWVHDEAKERNKLEVINEGKKWEAIELNVPIQENTDDCGVFLCKFADFICRGWDTFTFNQQHMQYFRSRMAHELLMEKAY